jgi:hypothetical protein
MPDTYFQLSTKNQASALDAASDASGRAPHLLETYGSSGRFPLCFNLNWEGISSSRASRLQGRHGFVQGP